MDSHRIIVNGLTALDDILPVVSEEDSASHLHRTGQGRFWLVDSLDGTKEFLRGTPEFTVNIALVDNGVAVADVIVAPALNTAYWGAVGQGAWRETATTSSRLTVQPITSHSVGRVTASRSHLDGLARNFLEQLGSHSLVQAGSSLKFCRIAEGAADLYPRFGPTCEWDIAAGQAILEAAGGSFVTLDEAAMRYGKAEVLNPPFVASNGRIGATNLRS